MIGFRPVDHAMNQHRREVTYLAQVECEPINAGLYTKVGRHTSTLTLRIYQ